MYDGLEISCYKIYMEYTRSTLGSRCAQFHHFPFFAMELYEGHVHWIYCNLCLERISSTRGYLCRRCLGRRGESECVHPLGINDLGVFPQLCVDCGYEFLVYAPPLRCEECRTVRAKVPAIPVVRLDQIVGLAGVVVHTEPRPVYDTIPRFELPRSSRASPLVESGVLAGDSTADAPEPLFTFGLCTPTYLPMGDPSPPTSPTAFILQ